MAKDLVAQAALRTRTMERKAADLVRRQFYQRTCRRYLDKDGRPQHQAGYYLEGLKPGVFLVPFGSVPDMVPGVGTVCPVCATELSDRPIPTVPVKPKKVRKA